jgi:hypothetical protein
MSDQIVEISESEAEGDIAKTYHDIRAVTGVGQVNTIWRHWASRPPALDWAWGAVRPLYDNGRVAAAAQALRDSIDVAGIVEVPMEAFRASGLGDHTVGTAASITDAYNLGNSQNLVVMPALAKFIADGGAGREAKAASTWTPDGERPRTLPPIFDLDDMTKEARDLVELLSVPLSPPDKKLIPSLYRHLAAWPEIMAMATATSFAPDKIAAAENDAKALADRAEAEAVALAAELAPLAGCDAPSAETLAEIGAMASAYARGPIATMTVLGTRLRPTYPDVKIMY